jgi:hypothetical protein
MTAAIPGQLSLAPDLAPDVPMSGRDSRGRFLKGNQHASTGGRARAERLTADERRAIARAGFRALVDQRFAGDGNAAREYIGKLGAWAVERAAYAGTILYNPEAYPHPGAMPAGERR